MVKLVGPTPLSGVKIVVCNKYTLAPLCQFFPIMWIQVSRPTQGYNYDSVVGRVDPDRVK